MAKSKPMSPAEYRQHQSNQAQQANAIWLTYLRSGGPRTHSRQTRTEHKARSTDCFKNDKGDVVQSEISSFEHIIAGDVPPSTVAYERGLHTMLNAVKSELTSNGMEHSSQSDCLNKPNSTVTKHCKAGTAEVDTQVDIASDDPDKISQYEHQVKKGLNQGCDKVQKNQNHQDVFIGEVVGGGAACAFALLGLYFLCQKIRQKQKPAQKNEAGRSLLHGPDEESKHTSEESKPASNNNGFTNDPRFTGDSKGPLRPQPVHGPRSFSGAQGS